MDMEMTLRRAPQAGFSMIEALIAAAILLMIALGLLPLFSRSIMDNSNGNDLTQGSNHGRTQLEELIQVPFNNEAVTVPGGANELEVMDSWAMGDPDEFNDDNEGWWPDEPTDKGTVLWHRTTRVRQFSVSDLDDGRLTEDEALPGGIQANFVHLKQVEVDLENEKSNSSLGGTRQMTFRVLKPF
jgi:hypothetical protein